jgi:phi13 family phage major tail protein
MSKNKVTFGLEKVHIAFLDDSGAAPAWGEPVHIPGAVSLSPEPQGEESTFYADNGPYFVYTNNNGYTAELVMALIPDEILAEMLGWEIDSNGMLVESTDGIPKEFALMGQIQGDKKNRRFVFYRCKASRPGKEMTIRSEGVEPSQDTLSLTILPIEVDGKNIVKGVIELSNANTAVYNGFFNAVTLPGAEPAAADKTALAAAIALGDTLDEADYTVDSWDVFSAALAAAVIVNEDVDAAQSEVNSARKALTEAILGLVPAES